MKTDFFEMFSKCTLQLPYGIERSEIKVAQGGKKLIKLLVNSYECLCYRHLNSVCYLSFISPASVLIFCFIINVHSTLKHGSLFIIDREKLKRQFCFGGLILFKLYLHKRNDIL